MLHGRCTDSQKSLPWYISHIKSLSMTFENLWQRGLDHSSASHERSTGGAQPRQQCVPGGGQPWSRLFRCPPPPGEWPSRMPYYTLIWMPYMYALYTCLMCMPYMHALGRRMFHVLPLLQGSGHHVCLIIFLHVCLICMPYVYARNMYALYVCS